MLVPLRLLVTPLDEHRLEANDETVCNTLALVRRVGLAPSSPRLRYLRGRALEAALHPIACAAASSTDSPVATS